MVKWWLNESLKEIGDLNCDINEWFSMVDGDLIAYLEWELQIWRLLAWTISLGLFEWCVMNFKRSPKNRVPEPECWNLGTLAPGSNFLPPFQPEKMVRWNEKRQWACMGRVAVHTEATSFVTEFSILTQPNFRWWIPIRVTCRLETPYFSFVGYTLRTKSMAVKEYPISSRQSFACPFLQPKVLRHKLCLLPYFLVSGFKVNQKTHIFLTNFRFVWWAASTVFACFCYFLFFVWTHLFPDSISLSPHFQCLNTIVFPWFPPKNLLTNQFSFPKSNLSHVLPPFSQIFSRSSRTFSTLKRHGFSAVQEGPGRGGYCHQHRGHPGPSIAAADHQGGRQWDETRQRALAQWWERWGKWDGMGKHGRFWDGKMDGGFLKLFEMVIFWTVMGKLPWLQGENEWEHVLDGEILDGKS